MGSDGLQVVLDQVASLAGQWEGLGAQLATTAPPPPGQPFQATTAAISGIDAMIGAAAGAFAARTQDGVAGMSTAAADYGKQEATNAADMSNITKVTVV